MRRTLLMIMAVALLLTQCRKPAVELPTAEPANTVSMTITAGPGGKTDISTTGGITWSSGDKIYVGYNGKYVGYLTLKSGAGSATGTFTGTVTGVSEGDQTFHFFYLGSNPPAVSNGAASANVSFDSQTGLRGGLGLCHVGHGSAKGAVSAGGVTGISVMMKSEVALARFSFTDGTSPYTGALTLSGDHIYNSMTVNFNGSFTHGEQAGNISLTGTENAEKYVMLVPAGAGSATLNFGGAYEGNKTLANGIEANKYYGQGGPIEVVLMKAPVPVTGVTVAPTELNLVVGANETLTAMVAPADATNKEVAWESDDTGVATVDGTGKVTAVAAGEAIITVTTADGGMKATCAVSVTPKPAPKFTVGVDGSGNPITVEFAPGNLYWDGSAFRFEENQWSFASTWNSSYVSHFKWSDAAHAVTGDYNYGGYLFTNATETTANSNFQVNGETEGTWRTLSKAEWNYLLYTRTSASSLRAWVTLVVADDVSVSGFVILPDGSTATASGITTSSALADTGAVFLPAAGGRWGTDITPADSEVRYWTSTYFEDHLDVGGLQLVIWADRLGFYPCSENYGRAIRLVRRVY